MFFSLNFLLLFITAINSRPNFINETTRANELNETLPMVLTADSSNVAIPNGDENVQLIGRGTVNLTLASNILYVKIDFHNCIGRVKFCYSSLEKNDKATLHCGNGFCGFEINGTKKHIVLNGKDQFPKDHLQQCRSIQMKETQTSYCGIPAASCKPLTDDKMITIIVDEVSPTCQTLIKNAKIPPTTTSTSFPSTKSAAQTKTSEASVEWYIWVIIGVALLLLFGIIIAIFVCWKKRICLFKKKTDEIDQVSLYWKVKS